MNLFLIGLPGSGKSTLGRELALQLNLMLVDTDMEIVTKEGKTIEEIFKDSGEEYFRKLEQSVLHKILEKNNQLISTGGGMPCFYDNIDQMNKRGVVIFIDVPVENIHQRLIGQRSQKRPMLEGKTDSEVLDFLKQKYKERTPYYSKAEIIIRGANIKAQEIIEKLNERKIN
jgi:shikimate kinase